MQSKKKKAEIFHYVLISYDAYIILLSVNNFKFRPPVVLAGEVTTWIKGSSPLFWTYLKSKGDQGTDELLDTQSL